MALHNCPLSRVEYQFQTFLSSHALAMSKQHYITVCNNIALATNWIATVIHDLDCNKTFQTFHVRSFSTNSN